MRLTELATMSVLATGCAHDPQPQAPRPETTGGALVLDLAPSNRPPIYGGYGFELLDEVSGKTCVTSAMRSTIRYWFGMPDLTKLTSDRLTQQAIASAAHDAISRLEDADTIVITRFVTESQGPDKICATVFGRAVRLTKEGAPPQEREPKKKHDETDLE